MNELYHQMQVLKKFYLVLEELRAEIDLRELDLFLSHCEDLYSFDSDDLDEVIDCTDKCMEYQDAIKSILSELF